MDNRRKETRKKLMAFTLVYDERRKLLGYLANITETGAMLIGERPLELEAHMTLDIELPDDLPGGGSRTLIIPARVARCVADPQSSREFDIGFEFMTVRPEQAERIAALLDRYHFRHRSWDKKETEADD